MQIVKPSITIIGPIDGKAILRRLEEAGRTCWKSEERIAEGTAERFIAFLIGKGHESVLEHEKVSVRVICDRGVSHECVRHRLASYSQESTRYCNYGKKTGEIAVIRPPGLSGKSYWIWRTVVKCCECGYLILLDMGLAPQIARSILPTCVKTEFVWTADLREWRLIFRQRTDEAAHPQMRELMIPLLAEFKTQIPVVFDDIEVVDA